MICPTCDGTGTARGFACGNGRLLTSWPCDRCGATGQISDEQHAEIERGRDVRAERMARGLTLRDAAKALGISAVELSAVERGRVDPAATLEKLRALS